ncbi:hypothetical protein [Legionella bozemanae]|uniref:Uncharacterized protein n=1 Tax=Legionella bozemanae TaxID=447 RepID=A0A0W0S234_LEGBO|nr:hypothetical protein [Legionella bozemanae]KTC77181.1 hypothetical protein Lboz_0134 [Legionella bozemanae]STO32793.1 Uncharacterised protein [Legionella bozemanae]
MKKKYESTTMGAAKKEKKKVSWNDGKTEGQIEKDFVKEGTAGSLKKEKINKELKKLVNQGYTEIEAAALLGKSSMQVGSSYERGQEIPKFIFTDPIFYASKEEIEQRKLLREQSSSKITPIPSSKIVSPMQSSSQDTEISYPPQRGSKDGEKEANRYSFFSPMTIGVAALAVVATIGIVASRK